jgi:hypothetical protein
MTLILIKQLWETGERTVAESNASRSLFRQLDTTGLHVPADKTTYEQIASSCEAAFGCLSFLEMQYEIGSYLL